MYRVLAIGVGGALGSMARYGLSTWVYGILGRDFPYGTLAVNVLGCLVMGILFTLFLERFSDSAVLRAGMLIGVLGGFTTFSSFSIETFNLVEQGEVITAGVYVLGSVLLCLPAAWLGVLIGRRL